VESGWRMARVADVSEHTELARAELCGMTFNTCTLEDGTLGGPGLGYPVTHTADNTLDHKLLITDPLSEGVENMKPEVILDEAHIPTNNTNTNNNKDGVNPIHDLKDPILNASPPTPHTNGTDVDMKTQEDTTTTTTTVDTTADTLPHEEEEESLATSETNGVDAPLKPLLYTDTTHNDDDVDPVVHITVNTTNTIQPSPIPEESTTPEKSPSSVNPSEEVLDESLMSEESPSKDDTSQTNVDAGSGNDSEASEATAATKQSGSDLESNKSESPSTVKKKKTKPMSASMQRLTAKKESPDKRGTELMSAAERKAKADELRKKKIEEQRAKDEERRAAVLERRKKMEALEKEKKEALFKRLTTKDDKPTSASTGASRPSPMKGRYSLSTSNLTQLKKNKVDLNATTTSVPSATAPTGAGPGTRPRTSMAERPKSAMQRPGMGYPPQKTKSFSSNADDRKKEEMKRPHTAFGSRAPSATSSKPSRPSPRQSLNTTVPARPQTAMGANDEPRKKSAMSARQLNESSERLSTTRKPTLPKAKSTSNVNLASSGRPASAAATTRPSTTNTKPKPPRASTPAKDKKETTPAATAGTKTSTPRKDQTATKKESTAKKESTVKKEPALKKELGAGAKKEGKKSGKEAAPAKKELTKEEAKKALAERRKKAKEEAEEKAREEREKDEEERLKREEEEKRLAEQLRLEEERQNALMLQLKKEEEERQRRGMEEKEQRDREERERIEEEQRVREEEIEKKAKLELERIQKEQERQEELLEQERIERKKRVEMIMARVSSKRASNEGGEGETSPSSNNTPTDTPPVTATPPPEMAGDAARLKVDDILRSRGFGKSTEDISKLLEKREELTGSATVVLTSETKTTTTTITTSDGDTTATVSSETSEVTMQNGNVVVELDVNTMENTQTNTLSLDEAPHTEETECPTTDITNQVVTLTLGETTTENGSSVEMSEQIEELKLTDDNNTSDSTTVNDTNNNKDFVADTTVASAPLNAWSDSNGNGVHSNGVHSNGVDVNGTTPEEQDKIVNGSTDLHLKQETEVDPTPATLEAAEWSKFDERMKQITPTTATTEVATPGEEKLWKVLEGKVEMSECY